jgi:acyl dehydratase
MSPVRGLAKHLLPLPRGSYEDALSWVGREREIQIAEVSVNWPMVKVFAAMVEDGNRSYWDEDFARRVWGDVVAPPGMLQVWLTALQWRPDGAGSPYPLCAMVPLPGDTMISTGVRTVFHAPMRVGDHLSMIERVDSVSPEKRTRLGRGHFVTTSARYRNQRGVLVAEHEHTLVRFDSASGRP